MKTDHNKNLTQKKMNKNKLLDFINSDIIGRDVTFHGPFGPRQILYCDYVASGKALKSIENYIQTVVLPMYGNTHTTTTVTSSQTTSFRREAKEIIRQAVGASDDDVVIFTGSGVTGAVHKLISVLNLTKPPVIFCGPFEHHSNLLPWREMGDNVTVVNISETAEGKVNLKHLEIALKLWKDTGRPMIGTFSAASNITGITTDTQKVSALLHKYNALSLWDYATAGPYMDINMHPRSLDGNNASKDAVFISMHKFVGSPDAPGLLIASKRLFSNQNKAPSGCGGGTVSFVTQDHQHYLHDIEVREEGGTPAIVGSIRAGIAFKLKETVGSESIMSRENELYKKAINEWNDIPEIEILGMLDSTAEPQEHKLAVFSFLIRQVDSGLYLHYNFVTALLNDLFGIQSRGGCGCAGVYALNLLGINKTISDKFEKILVPDLKKSKNGEKGVSSDRTELEILRPGFTRLNFAYFMSDEDADYVIKAVTMIAKHGWLLLPSYKYDAYTGEWHHIGHKKGNGLKYMADVDLEEGGACRDEEKLRDFDIDINDLPSSRAECLAEAETIMLNAKEVNVIKNESAENTSLIQTHELRWFLLPREAEDVLEGEAIKIEKSKMSIAVRRNIQELTNEDITLEVTNNLDVLRIEKQNKILNAIATSNVRNTLRRTKKVKNNKEIKKPLERKITLTENDLSRATHITKKKGHFWNTLMCKSTRSVKVATQNKPT
uniref:uncharacterized protein LOC120337785 n=1 Tax=Styela clava TaxID=7725 RepID=UPI001939E0D0|nr:uncharacterized protein LOC120337785 [Styela clava]